VSSRKRKTLTGSVLLQAVFLIRHQTFSVQGGPVNFYHHSKRSVHLGHVM